MIDGLRVLPWLEDARRKDPTLLDCKMCMERNTDATRERMGCGWLPRIDPDRVRTWSFGIDGLDSCETCPGYVAPLPDVIDVRETYPHWKTGQVASCVPGELPETLLAYLAILDGSIKALQAKHAKGDK